MGKLTTGCGSTSENAKLKLLEDKLRRDLAPKNIPELPVNEGVLNEASRFYVHSDGELKQLSLDELKVSLALASGTNSLTVNENGNWVIDGKDSGIKAQGPVGKEGPIGPKGNKGDDGNTGNGIKSIEHVYKDDSEDPLVDFYRINFTDETLDPFEFIVHNGVQGKQGEVGPQGPAGNPGIQGITGQKGADGQNGITPHIADDGNWHIGDINTNVKAQGPAGENGQDGAVGQQGPEGPAGKDGQNGKDGRGIIALNHVPDASPDNDIYEFTYTEGEPDRFIVQHGKAPKIGTNDNWYINDIDTGKPSIIKYTAGEGIKIENNTISTISSGGATPEQIAQIDKNKNDIANLKANKQDNLIAGQGIIIENNVISTVNTGGTGGGGVDLSKYIPVVNVFNPDDPDIVKGKYLIGDDVWQNDGNFCESGYIPVKFGKKYRSMNKKGDNWQIHFNFYDADKKFIRHLYPSPTPYVVVTDTNAAYMRIPIGNNNLKNKLPLYDTDILITEYKPYNEPFYIDEKGTIVDVQKPNPGGTTVEETHWKGKTWYAYGTSMTSVAQGKYVPVVTKLSGMQTVNKGIPGGGITNNGGYAKGQVKAAIMNTTDGKLDADLITFEVGPNEGPKLGEDNIYRLDDETFCGCFNQCIRYLQENTKAQIVVIPMVGGKDTTPETILSNGLHTDEFHALINRLAYINGVPVIDVFGSSGFGYGRVYSGKYQVDNIHLNELGGDNMGRFIWSKLKDIPIWKTQL